MSPRSLVGMTQGARKRAARRYVTENYDARSTPQFVHVGHLLYAEARARYRVGERLRPCPGCARCELLYCLTAWIDGRPVPCRLIHDGALAKVRIGRKTAHLKWTKLSTAGTAICDGSGVLPARKRRRP